MVSPPSSSSHALAAALLSWQLDRAKPLILRGAATVKYSFVSTGPPRSTGRCRRAAPPSAPRRRDAAFLMDLTMPQSMRRRRSRWCVGCPGSMRQLAGVLFLWGVGEGERGRAGPGTAQCNTHRLPTRDGACRAAQIWCSLLCIGGRGRRRNARPRHSQSVVSYLNFCHVASHDEHRGQQGPECGPPTLRRCPGASALPGCFQVSACGRLARQCGSQNAIQADPIPAHRPSPVDQQVPGGLSQCAR